MPRIRRRRVRGSDWVFSASAAEEVSPSAIRSGRCSRTATWITCTGQAPMIRPSSLERSSVIAFPCVVRDAAWRPLLTMTKPVESPEVVILRSPRSGRLEGRKSVHVLAAVDRERRAGDELGILGAEEGDAAGDLLGAAEAADGDAGLDLLQHVGRHGGDHVGVDVAGGQGVDGDAVAGAFLGQGLGEAVDAALGG